jgi:hypothetical protein
MSQFATHMPNAFPNLAFAFAKLDIGAMELCVKVKIWRK